MNIKRETKDNILEVTLNRPERLNALDWDMLAELRKLTLDITTDIAQGQAPRLVVLRSSSEKAFVAGADIKCFASDLARAQEFAAFGQEVISDFADIPVPKIAVIHGYALGGGLELALACDLIATTTQSIFGFPETGLGLVPGFGGTLRAALRIGTAGARRMIITGDKLTGDQALLLGLVDYCAPLDEFQSVLNTVIQQVISVSPLAVRSALILLNELEREVGIQALKREKDCFASLLASDEGKEGVRAFVEKRPPLFG
ncbi:MAG: enoyl-CoA hydratase/isomerase family protein [bacterium]|nr:enoyl-CoA hydratase/isomerase family protein [bacterium]